MLDSMPVVVCACDTCKSMCMRPCWPTPAEAKRLIDSGHGEKLMLDWWESDDRLPFTYILCPASEGYEGQRASFWPHGACVFQDPETRLCRLHDTGMKPIEGRLADCKNPPKGLHLEVAKTWNTPEGKAVVEEWRQRFDQ